MQVLHDPADVIFHQALVQESPQPLADPLDAEGEAVLVPRDLQIQQPRGAGQDVHPLAHEIHPMVHAGKAVQEDGEAAFEGKRHTLRAILQMQARHLATFLRRERSEYVPFEMTW